MAKKKKTRNTQRSAAKGFGVNPSALKAALAKVEQQIDQGKIDAALETLVDLDQRYPDHSEILDLLAYLCLELEYWPKYQEVMERLVKLRPHDLTLWVALGRAYLQNQRLRLALDVFRQLRKQFPNDPHLPDIETTIAQLEKGIAEIADQLGIELDEQAYEVIRLHERTLSALEMSHFEDCRNYALQLLDLNPDFLPARNNLAMTYWMEHRIQEAIAITEKTLELDPHNIHALANLIQFHTLNGDRTTAQEYYDPLQAALSSQPQRPEMWLKAAESFSFLEVDAALLDLFQQAETAGILETVNPAFYHYVAVAQMNQGQEAVAKQLWETALEKDPNLDLAYDNLEDLKYPVGFRNCPWRFQLPQWITLATAQELLTILNDE
ncbi:MAG: tetratricopeptide repeat protein, partial [Kamptonema sp. SIO4C4]|nr:tetratricopeptide repeat protein [Kamptonema sp. SIO4C4]